MSLQSKTQRCMLRNLSMKLIKYTKDKNDPEALKPYYLFRICNNDNEIKAYLIGYKFKIALEGPSYYNPEFEKLNLVTRSKKQIHEGIIPDNTISNFKTYAPLLGVKSLLLDSDWEITPDTTTRSVSSYIRNICTIEGEVYADAVWLQDYDPKTAVLLLIKNKEESINKLQANIEKQKQKLKDMEDFYNKLKGV